RLLLARTSPSPLGRHDLAADEHLAAPDAPRLGALDGTGEAGLADRAAAAQRLGELDVRLPLREPEVGVLRLLARGDDGRLDQREVRLLRERPRLRRPLAQSVEKGGELHDLSP